jgi:hypothetical protein
VTERSADRRQNKSEDRRTSDRRRAAVSPRLVLTVRLSLVVHFDKETVRIVWSEGRDVFERAFGLDAIVSQWWSEQPVGDRPNSAQSVALAAEWTPNQTGLVTDEESASVTDSVREILQVSWKHPGLLATRHKREFIIQGRKLENGETEGSGGGARTGVFADRLAESRDLGQDGLEFPLKEPPVPSSSELAHAQTAFIQAVAKADQERQRHVIEVQKKLSAYLRRWDDEQERLTQSNSTRPADEIAGAKKALSEELNAAFARLGVSIQRDNEPCNLFFVESDRNRRGQFKLTPKGKNAPIAVKARLADIFDFARGEPILDVSARREALTEFREREQARRQKQKSRDIQ